MVDNVLFGTGSTVTGTGTISKTGAGYVDFWNNSSIKNFTGTVNVVAGTLSTNTADWNTIANKQTLNINTGTFFDDRTSNVYVDRLTGSGTIGSTYTAGATVFVGTNNSSSTFSGTLQNTLTGYTVANNPSIALDKIGVGSLTLTGASTYTGLTTVGAGTLYVANTTGRPPARVPSP